MKSGKSGLASQIALASGKQPVLIATATAMDDEMRRRIARHRRDRSGDWRVIEEPLSIAESLLSQSDQTVVVIDCLTLWLTNLLLPEDQGLLEREQTALLQALDCVLADVVLVSNEVSMGIVPMGELSRRYCDVAGILHQRVASCCDTVVLSVAGLPLYLKGQCPGV